MKKTLVTFKQQGLILFKCDCFHARKSLPFKMFDDGCTMQLQQDTTERMALGSLVKYD